MTFNREWNPQLPAAPGQHGIVFCGLQTFDDRIKVDIPVTFFVREGPNQWQQMGLYSIKRWGEISPKHLNLLPPTMIAVWVHGALVSDWGKKWVEGTNENILENAQASGSEPRLVEYTDEGMRAALADGRLIISFTIMQCVGFRHDWHDQLLHSKDHPKPPKTQKRKRASGKQEERVSKNSKGKGTRRIVKHESEVDSDDDSDGNGNGSSGGAESSEDEGGRRIAKLPAKRLSGWRRTVSA